MYAGLETYWAYAHINENTSWSDKTDSLSPPREGPPRYVFRETPGSIATKMQGALFVQNFSQIRSSASEEMHPKWTQTANFIA